MILAMLSLLSCAALAGETLYALNSIRALPDMARLYDAAMPRPWTLQVELDRVRPELPRAEIPFVLPIPPAPPPEFQRTFRRLLTRPDRTRAYDALIRERALTLGLDARLVKAIVAAESEFTPRAQSPAGAVGLMQVMRATAEYMGVSAGALFDPLSNIRAGTAYLAHLFARAWKRYHLSGVPYSRAPQWLIQRVVAAYNAGPRFLARRKLYRETREYIRKVLLYYRSAVSDI